MFDVTTNVLHVVMYFIMYGTVQYHSGQWHRGCFFEHLHFLPWNCPKIYTGEPATAVNKWETCLVTFQDTILSTVMLKKIVCQVWKQIIT